VDAIKEEIGCGLLRQLYEYWDSRRPPGGLPRRSDIDPAHIPHLLPHIFLVAVERADGLRFRYRLAGTYVEAATKRRITGLYIEELAIDENARQEMIARYRECVDRRVPIVSRHKFTTDYQRDFDYQRLLLPVALDAEERADMILGGISFRLPFPTPRIPFGPKLNEAVP
jgi:hypothetical protein